MKNIKFLLIALIVAPLFVVSSGCGGDEVPPTPVDTTTTPTDTIFAGMKVGFDVYELVIDNSQSDAHYRAADGKTTIFVVGYSEKGPNGVVDGKGEIEIALLGNDVGTWSQASGDEVTLEVATGTPPKRNEYSYDANSNINVTITEYGPVGGKIKGTFSGKLKSGINSIDVSKGFFEVVRSADQ